jgi:hypothetical protein
MRVSLRFPAAPLSAFLLLGSLLLSCGGSEEATSDVVIEDEEGPVPTVDEARSALNDALRAYNRYCLVPEAQKTQGYPITRINPSGTAPSFEYQQLRALQQAGLLDTTVVQSAGELPVHKFDLTDAGRETQYQIARGRGYDPRFCYAIPEVSRVDSIKAVFNSGPNELARVWFAYRYTELKPWVETPSVQRMFSGVEPLPSPDRERTAEQLLIRIGGIGGTWVDRRLAGAERP